MNDIKDNSPLSKIKKELPFTVPDGYFDNFQERLNLAIYDRKRIGKPVNFRITARPYLAAAILLIVALAGGSILFRTNHNQWENDRIHSEIIRVVDQELYSISEETILETIAEDQQVKKPDEPEDMINYLLRDDLNEDELINAL